ILVASSVAPLQLPSASTATSFPRSGTSPPSKTVLPEIVTKVPATKKGVALLVNPEISPSTSYRSPMTGSKAASLASSTSTTVAWNAPLVTQGCTLQCTSTTLPFVY